MKLKVDQIRTYDDAGFRRRAACLCFRSECESEILLVSSSRYHDLWVVPGGGLEPGEEPATAAVREMNEEAGVIGKLGRLLDVFENKDRKTRTYVYVMVVEELKDEYDDSIKIGRLRRWFSLDEAEKELAHHKPVQLEYIDKLYKEKDHQRRVSLCTNASLNSRLSVDSTQYGHLTATNYCSISRKPTIQSFNSSQSIGDSEEKITKKDERPEIAAPTCQTRTSFDDAASINNCDIHLRNSTEACNIVRAINPA